MIQQPYLNHVLLLVASCILMLACPATVKAQDDAAGVSANVGEPTELSPNDKSAGIDPANCPLMWKAGAHVQDQNGHLVFIGTDREIVRNASYRNQTKVKLYEVSKPGIVVEDLQSNTVYYWRVEQVNSRVAPNLWTSPVYQFKTKRVLDANSTLFTDGFKSTHDYLKDGVGKTGWASFIGRGPKETADVISAGDGILTLESTNGRYEGSFDPLGPFLYRVAKGDFTATVKITDYDYVSYNNGGLMARAANPKDPDEAGPGEDWVSLDYFPLYGGIYIRQTNNNVREETSNSGQGRNADRFLQMQRVGNLFYMRQSPDGQTWKELPHSPIERPDLNNVPLQVGLFQCTYSSNKAKVSFADYSLVETAPVKHTRPQSPEPGSESVPTGRLTLNWIPGSGATYHDVYLGTDRQAVQNATRQSPEYVGRKTDQELSHKLSNLPAITTHYWRVDAINGDELHKGTVWEFTTFDPFIATDGEWNVQGPASINTKDGLAIEYDGQEDQPARISRTFEETQDWFRSDYGLRTLNIRLRGELQKTNLAVVVKDVDWGSTESRIAFDGQQKPTDSTIEWEIDLQDLVNANPRFRLAHVGGIAFEVAGASGASVTIENIELKTKANPLGRDTGPNYVNPNAFANAVEFSEVRVTDGLWRERMDVNRKSSTPHVWGRCEASTYADGKPTSRLDNFRRAGGLEPGGFTGLYFNDSDVYKMLEGTAYLLRNKPDPELEAYADEVVDAIAAAQWDDGYIFTFYSLPKKQPKRRWTDVGHAHELYCAGHLFDGAVAYYQATGKRKILDVAIRFADLISETFGPNPDQLPYPPGHQQVEMGLVRLYEVTREKRYLDTAKFFIDARGENLKGRSLYGDYSQDHLPFVKQEKGVGHSVRAGYMYVAAMDLARRNNDEAYANALTRIWDNVVNKKTYLTGGLGQPGGPEGFADDYRLDSRCYAETCSGIAYSMWNHRWHLMTGEGKYMDLAERTLLNNMLGALSKDGTKHYYTNPLSADGHERWEWPVHDCACCPSNLVRVIASIGGYAYSQTADTVNVNLYIDSEANLPVHNKPVNIKQTTRYPWDGNIEIRLSPESPIAFKLRLRIPGWVRGQPMPGNLYRYVNDEPVDYSIRVNGKDVDVNLQQGYVTLDRTWNPGDVIRLDLPMTVRRVVSHPAVVANKGLVAFERGPLVYCAESIDNPQLNPGTLSISEDMEFEAVMDPNLLGGTVKLVSKNGKGLTLIPTYQQANRGRSWVRVWMPQKKSENE